MTTLQTETQLMLLLVEDDQGDACYTRSLLGRDPRRDYEVHTVSSLQAAEHALQHRHFDAVLLDLNLADSSHRQTFYNLRPLLGDLPVIVLSGLEDESVAEELVGQGAQDFLLKSNLSTELLGRSIAYAVERNRYENEQLRLHTKLEAAREHIARLHGLLPICAWCHRIRDEDEQWQPLEKYLQAHAEIDFTHGLCPECLKKEMANIRGQSRRE